MYTHNSALIPTTTDISTILAFMEGLTMCKDQRLFESYQTVHHCCHLANNSRKLTMKRQVQSWTVTIGNYPCSVWCTVAFVNMHSITTVAISGQTHTHDATHHPQAQGLQHFGALGTTTMTLWGDIIKECLLPSICVGSWIKEVSSTQVNAFTSQACI